MAKAKKENIFCRAGIFMEESVAMIGFLCYNLGEKTEGLGVSCYNLEEKAEGFEASFCRGIV